MPEVAEVHLNVDMILKKKLGGEILREVEINSGKYMHKKPKDYNAFVAELPSKVEKINVRGKFIWIELENGWNIGIGFGMTGRFTLNSNRKEEDIKHIRITMRTKEEEIYYEDYRNFGNWNFWRGREELDKKLGELGYDVLYDDKLTKVKVMEKFRKYNKWEISKALMSQKILAGPGNYIRAESLYDAKIYPYAKVVDLKDDEIYKLYKSVVKIAKMAYKMQKKNFEKNVPYEEYQDKMKVYNKKEDPMGRKVTRSADTRTTWWVPEVQIIGKK